MLARHVMVSLLLMGAACAAVAQDSAPPPGETSIISANDIDLERLRQAVERVNRREMLRMSLAECVEMALRQNADIQVAAKEPDKSSGDILASHGEFDPVLQGRGVYSHSLTSANQQVLVFGGVSEIESFNTNLTGSISGKLHLGTQYNLQFNMNKDENTFGGFVEQFDAFLTATITQPLLRGYGQVNTIRIRAAENNKNVTEAQLRLTMLNTLADVVRSYWDLVGSVENLNVRQEALANAERLLQINEKRRDLGTAADIEVLQAKAGVAMRQSEIIAARTQIINASNVLRERMGLEQQPGASELQVVPVDRPNPEDLSVFDPNAFEDRQAQSVAKAIEMRPEMQMSDIEIENAELDADSARNNMLPQVDVVGSYGQGGRDHYLRKTLEGVARSDDNSYSIGIQASVPIGNRAARGAYERSKHTVRQSELRREQTRRRLELNVRLAAESVVSNLFLVESNKQTVRLQQANVAAEEKRLNLGVTTSYQVLQVQEDLTAAQTQLVQAEIAYEKALTDLHLAEGSLMQDLGVEFVVADTEESIGYWQSIEPDWKQFQPHWK